MKRDPNEKFLFKQQVFVQATQELSAYNPSITSILIRDIFVAITQSRMVLDGLLIRTNLKRY